MANLANTLKQLSALSQETRLLTFKMLMEAGPEGIQAGVIAEKLNVAPNSLSAHLSILSDANLVSSERQGRHIIYRPNIPTVNVMLASMIENCCNGHPEVCGSLSNIKCVPA